MSVFEMGLPPLEYSDCFLDSPSFRETIALYELELESNTRVVKNLVKECDNMIQKTEGITYHDTITLRDCTALLYH